MGDEGCIKLWDIAETKSIPLKVFDAVHSDHIRCSDASILSDHLFVSGNDFCFCSFFPLFFSFLFTP